MPQPQSQCSQHGILTSRVPKLTPQTTDDGLVYLSVLTILLTLCHLQECALRQAGQDRRHQSQSNWLQTTDHKFHAALLIQQTGICLMSCVCQHSALDVCLCTSLTCQVIFLGFVPSLPNTLPVLLSQIAKHLWLCPASFSDPQGYFYNDEVLFFDAH